MKRHGKTIGTDRPALGELRHRLAVAIVFQQAFENFRRDEGGGKAPALSAEFRIVGSGQ